MTRRKTLQQRIVGGAFTLPLAVLWVMVWWVMADTAPIYYQPGTTFLWSEMIKTLPTAYGHTLVGASLLLIATLLLWAIHSKFNIIRTHYAFSLSLFVLLAGMFSPCTLHIGQLVLVSVLHALYRFLGIYQKTAATGELFAAFLPIAVVSLFFPSVLCIVLFFTLYAVPFKVFTWRSCCAIVIALLLPYWFFCLYALFVDINLLEQFCLGLFETTFNAYVWLFQPYLEYAFLVLLIVVGGFYAQLYSHHDKVRSRVFLMLFLLLAVWVAILALLYPDCYTVWVMLLTPIASVIGGHFFTLTQKWSANVFFIVCFILFVALICWRYVSIPYYLSLLPF